MSQVSIRDVDDDVWAEFKARAASNHMKLSDYFERLLEETRESETNWEEILFGEKVLDENDAEKIMKASKEIRKNFKMREFNWD